jgi:hypothetical protein
MRLLKITFVLLMISLISCKKENNIPIVEPGSYFPVYPDSWWKYSINDSLIIMDSTSDSYILGYYLYTYEDCYVPYYNSAPGSPIVYIGPIFKYDKTAFISKKGPGTVYWPILSENIGHHFDMSPRVSYNPIVERALVEGKIFNGQDSILIINSHFTKLDYEDTLPLKRHREYIKNIGLAIDILYDTIKNDTVSKIILIDHHINK